jgi:hypothetical protein
VKAYEPVQFGGSTFIGTGTTGEDLVQGGEGYGEFPETVREFLPCFILINSVSI